MLSSLQAGLSGLQSHQTYLDVIGNNLANANTTAFKSSRITFTDLFANTLRNATKASSGLGGQNPAQIGTGVRVGSVDSRVTQGAVLTTGRPFDLGIQGEGFFILSDGNQEFYSRNGAFGIDGNNSLVDLATGMRVQSSTLSDIVIDSSQTIPPRATSALEMAGNLPALVTGPLKEVVTTNVALLNGSPASLTSAVGPYNVAIGDDFTVRVNGGAAQQVTFIAGDIAVPGAATTAEVEAVINRDVTGITASVVGGAVVVTTENTGENASLDFDDGTGTPLAAIGISTSQVSGTQSTATATTTLNNLVTNNADYVAGDIITLTGTDADGLAIQSNFIYGAGVGQNGTTLGDLVTFVDNNYASATASLDTNGNLVLTADAAGEANLSIFLHDDQTATGSTLWPSFSVSTDGTGPDTVNTSASVFDSMGVSHTLVFSFTRYFDNNAGAAGAGTNDWDVNVSIQNNEGSVTTNQIKRIRFNNDGSFGAIIGDGGPDPVGQTVSLTFNNIGEEQTISIDFGTQSGYDGLSQVGETGSVQIAGNDGYAAGALSSLSVEPNGEILGHYTNGKFNTMASIGLANFSNPAGLSRTGDSLFNISPNSGNAVLGVPGSGSNGSILTGALEQSNVDIGEEFVSLIEAQRGFQANARIITTSDEILTEMVNLVR